VTGDCAVSVGGTALLVFLCQLVPLLD